ncbi:MAG: transposase [Nitrospinae bacterium]|nr:transposase [Nitrospinota bacterium]
MKQETRQRKHTTTVLKALRGQEWLAEHVVQILETGKESLDRFLLELGGMVAETIMLLEREELAGPDYCPKIPGVYKWAGQPGSVYIGDQKVRVVHPRLRGSHGEIPLPTYGKLRERRAFSDALLAKALRGLSAQKYQETVVEAAQAFGVSATAVSTHLIEATTQKLKTFTERSLEDFTPFAVFLDTIHRGGDAFVVALGIDRAGQKRVLGFWQGATENHDICEELLDDLERRDCCLPARVLFITDGGSGIRKALTARYGKKLLHQRCTIHKTRNIQRHLPKRWRKEAHRRFHIALEQTSYTEAKAMLTDLEGWLRTLNESAADSLREACEELLTVHRLKVPALLRKTLHTTNPIESMFSTVRDCEGNIKRYRGSTMRQRWLAAVCLHCEKGFRTVKGFREIAEVISHIEAEQAALQKEKAAA